MCSKRETKIPNTFGECYRPKIVGIHDFFVNLQWRTLRSPLQLYASIVNEYIHTSIAIQDFFSYILDADYIREI